MNRSPRHFVLITQVYPPDAAAVGQHFEDVAVRLARRGHRVTVYTADRDHDNPRIKHGSESRHERVLVVRLPMSNMGKRSMIHRISGQVSFLVQTFFRLLFKKDVDGLVITTIPATTGVMIRLLGLFRSLPIMYWVMDVNPDQAVALGVFKEGSLPVRVLRWCNRRLFADASRIVVLDRYMLKRLVDTGYLAESDCDRVAVIPPWPLEEHLEPVAREGNPFLVRHQLTTKRCIFMYSGNHSLAHPLGTYLSAIQGLEEREDLAFLFVGGGRGKEDVDRITGSRNVLSLPYQPLNLIRESLSAADVQVVILGEGMSGIVHPCKIYGAMALAKPVLLVGPRDSNLGELVEENGFGWVVGHGETSRLRSTLLEIADLSREERDRIGELGRKTVEKTFQADLLGDRFCTAAESMFTGSQE